MAARKNAYSLVGKHRHGGAAAFFILGGNIKEAVDLYVLSKDENLDMALLITRSSPTPYAPTSFRYKPRKMLRTGSLQHWSLRNSMIIQCSTFCGMETRPHNPKF